MTGIDTNVLIRYLVQDHPTESEAAARFIEGKCTREDPGFINHIVLCEIIWVLESAYHFKKPVVIEVLERILMTAQLMIEQKDEAWGAFQRFRNSKADFADCLIGYRNRTAGCRETVTFDRDLKNLDEFLLL